MGMDLFSFFRFDSLRKHSSTDVDSAVFKLHYKVTTNLLLAFCILATATSLVGDPVRCITTGNTDILKEEAINIYCWIHTTFTLPNYHQSKHFGEIVYPGLGTDTDEDEKIYHAYYQWVPFILFFQALLFYIPHVVWETWEGKKINSLASCLANPVVTKEERQEKASLVAHFLSSNLHNHNVYALKFLICEILNTLNALFNMWILNKFFGGSLTNFGLDVLEQIQQNPEERNDTLILVFPRMTKCTFNMFGPSGTLEKHDFLCILALNVINEKIFVFLWFWIITLVALSLLATAYRLILFCFPIIRNGLLQKKVKFEEPDAFRVFSKYLNFGDWFVLYLLSKNIDVISLSTILTEMYKEYGVRHSYSVKIGRKNKKDKEDNGEESIGLNHLILG